MVTLLCTVMHAPIRQRKLHSFGAEFACTLQAPTKPTADDDAAMKRIQQSDVGLSASQLIDFESLVPVQSGTPRLFR